MQQLQDLIRSKVPELFQCDIDENGTKSYYEIEIKHWLPLLMNKYTINTDGNLIMLYSNFFGWGYIIKEGKNIKYNFSKSFEDQDESFHQWLYNELNK